MTDWRLRSAIAARAAQLMYAREESEYFTAKRKAAKQMGVNFKFAPKDLPSNAEIRDAVAELARLMEGPAREETITAMRVEALRWMRVLERFRPHLIGSVMTGHVRRGSDIDLHVFADSLSSIELALDDVGAKYTVERKSVSKAGVSRVYRHIHIDAEFPIELTIYTAAEVNFPFRSSITGDVIERLDANGLATLLRSQYPDLDLESEMDTALDHADAPMMYRLLLEPLSAVRQSPKYHPEGDALYHSLQVFELARAECPWDEELVTAALLHDVGKAIDPADHVGAAVESLEGLVTERTLWLVGHHMDAHAVRDRTIGARAQRRLRAHPDFDDLMRLNDWDRAGRQRGAIVCSVDEAIAWLCESVQ